MDVGDCGELVVLGMGCGGKDGGTWRFIYKLCSIQQTIDDMLHIHG